MSASSLRIAPSLVGDIRLRKISDLQSVLEIRRAVPLVNGMGSVDYFRLLDWEEVPCVEDDLQPVVKETGAMSDKLKAAAEDVIVISAIPNIVCNEQRWYRIVSPATKLARDYLSRFAADEQQGERIATLERERDEARAAFVDMRDLLESTLSSTTRGEAMGAAIRVLQRFPDKPEWRKGGDA